jgi:hypothetical protein
MRVGPHHTRAQRPVPDDRPPRGNAIIRLVTSLIPALAIAATSALASWAQMPGADPLNRPPLPVVYLLYPPPNGTIFDVNCGELLKTTVDPDAVTEVVRRAPEMQALWNRDGPGYLSATLTEIGLPFPFKEVQAVLTVCPGVRSMSAPLMINVRRFLTSAPVRDPDWLLAETVYHELMHTYVRPVNGGSALRKKYGADAPVVLNHLHVMALEKFVLLKLGKSEELKRVGLDYQTLLPPPYKRAWTIVNEIEGHEPFVNELKQLAQSHR